MFNGPSNIIIQGGTFINAGNINSAFFPPRSLLCCATMFNGSSKIIIRGGTFINAGNINSASLKEQGVNISQNSAIEWNHKRGSNHKICIPHGRGSTNQLPHSAENFGTSVYASGQVPEYSPCHFPTPSVTSEVKSWETAGTSRRNAKQNGDSHALPLHSQCLAISQSHNTMRTRLRSTFADVIQLFLGLMILSLAHRHQLTATMSGRPQTHSQHLLPLFRPHN